jgi:tripartite-type tricarboxylate transporter receptor subunit TctC
MRKHILVATLAALTSIAPALADGYPTKPITFIVPFAAGGPLDLLARAIAEPMGAQLGQPVVIENIVGAAGSIGVGRAVHAAPDGYTVSVGNWSTHVVNGAIYSLQYDLLTDLAPVVLLPSSPQLIVAKNTMPAANVRELVTWLHSTTANVGTAGVGSASHVSGLFLQNMTKTQFAFVSYRSGGAALQDLVAGHIDLMLDQASNSLPQIRAGAIKTYAVTSKSRLAVAPDIPTVDEAGLPQFHISVWNGLWVPKGTPPDVIARLNAAAVKAMASPSLQKRFADLGQEEPTPDQLSPAALAAFQKAEIDKWWPIVKAANIKAN